MFLFFLNFSPIPNMENQYVQIPSKVIAIFFFSLSQYLFIWWFCCTPHKRDSKVIIIVHRIAANSQFTVDFLWDALIAHIEAKKLHTTFRAHHIILYLLIFIDKYMHTYIRTFIYIHLFVYINELHSVTYLSTIDTSDMRIHRTVVQSSL